MKAYVICDDDCRHEGMTKEQILAAIQQAVENGYISDPDGAIISRLREINKGGAARVWVGTEAEYNALSPMPTAHKLAVRMGADGVLYICTDDSTLADYERHAQNKENPHGVTLEQVLDGTDEATAKKARETIGAAETAHKHTKADISDFAHKHTKSEITDFPDSMPASDVSEWAKQATKPTYTAAEVGIVCSETEPEYVEGLIWLKPVE